jgi:hypothetical protein
LASGPSGMKLAFAENGEGTPKPKETIAEL